MVMSPKLLIVLSQAQGKHRWPRDASEATGFEAQSVHLHAPSVPSPHHFLSVNSIPFHLLHFWGVCGAPHLGDAPYSAPPHSN
jgi:hypothetical protein